MLFVSVKSFSGKLLRDFLGHCGFIVLSDIRAQLVCIS